MNKIDYNILRTNIYRFYFETNFRNKIKFACVHVPKFLKNSNNLFCKKAKKNPKTFIVIAENKEHLLLI